MQKPDENKITKIAYSRETREMLVDLYKNDILAMTITASSTLLEKRDMSPDDFMKEIGVIVASLFLVSFKRGAEFLDEKETEIKRS